MAAPDKANHHLTIRSSNHTPRNSPDWAEKSLAAWKPAHECLQHLYSKLPQGVSSPGDPVVRTLHFHCWGAQVWSLVRERGSRKPRGMAKKKKKKNCPKLETTKTSFSRWTGKLGTTDNGMLLSVQRKWGSSREGTQRNRKGTLLSDRNQSERAWDSRHVTSGTTETVKAGTVARGSGWGGGEHRMFRAANLDDALTAETRHYAFVKTPRTRQHQQRTLLTTMDFR